MVVGLVYLCTVNHVTNSTVEIVNFQRNTETVNTG